MHQEPSLHGYSLLFTLIALNNPEALSGRRSCKRLIPKSSVTVCSLTVTSWIHCKTRSSAAYRHARLIHKSLCLVLCWLNCSKINANADKCKRSKCENLERFMDTHQNPLRSKLKTHEGWLGCCIKGRSIVDIQKQNQNNEVRCKGFMQQKTLG